MIVLSVIEGMLKIIPIDSKGTLQDAYNMRVPDRELQAMCFVRSAANKSCIAYVSRVDANRSMLRTFLINVREKTLVDGPVPSTELEGGVTQIAAVGEGLLCVGETQAVWIGPDGKQISARFERALGPSVCRALGRVDERRLLAADEQGGLWLLACSLTEGIVGRVQIESYGTVAGASALCYLDGGCVFVAGALGDSQVVRLLEQRDEESGMLIEEVQRVGNLGPVLDMLAVDQDGQGQSALVLAAGAFADASLRVVRNGIGVTVEAELPLPGITGVWAMRTSTAAAVDSLVCVGFAARTVFLAMEDDDDLAELSQSGGLAGDTRTLFCGTTVGDQIVQITARGVRLVAAGPGHALREHWEAPKQGEQLTVCGADVASGIIVVGLSRTLVCLRVVGQRLVEQGRCELEQEASCVDCSPFESGQDPTCVAVGTWGHDASVQIRELPSLALLKAEPLGSGGVVARSVRLCALDQGEPRLLVGLGDGRLLQYRLLLPDWTLAERKQVPLGTQACLLTSLPNNVVFAGGDRPAVAYSASRKLVVANVNLQHVSHVCSFSTLLYPDCLCLATRDTLLVGSLESIQQLHTHTVPLQGEMARRLAYVPSEASFVLGMSHTMGRVGLVRALDHMTFERVAELLLEPAESVCAVQSVQLAGQSLVAVGTAFIHEMDPEPTRGRLLLLAVERGQGAGRLSIVCERRVTGAAYSLCQLGDRLAVGINARVELLELVAGPPASLLLVAEHHGHVMALHLRARGEFLLVGDLMRSMTLLRLDSVSSKLVAAARDYANRWLTAVAFAGEDCFLGCDQEGSLVLTVRSEDAESQRLRETGCFNVGAAINVLRSGRLVMPDPTLAVVPSPPILYGCVDGSLGAIVPISKDEYAFFKALETQLALLPTVGNISHEKWRGVKRKPHSSFVDGDLIETFPELGLDDQTQIALVLGMQAGEITQRVEDMARSIH